MRLNRYERDILRHLNGDVIPGFTWGHKMSVTLGFLKGCGMVQQVLKPGCIEYVITKDGREALKQ